MIDSFDIRINAPSASELDGAREKARSVVQATGDRELKFLGLCATIAVACLGGVVTSTYSVRVPSGVLLQGFAFAFFLQVMFMCMLRLSVLNFAIGFSAATAGAMAWVGSEATAGLPMVTGVASLGFAGTVYLGLRWLLESWVQTPRCRAEQALNALAPVTEKGMPRACIKFMELVDANEDVRRYQRQLAAMGRLPVLGEVTSAMRFADDRKQLDRASAEAEAARFAAARMALPY
jgi:hypothetical protein